MSINYENAANASDQSETWTDSPQKPANDTSSAPRANISAADAFGALADAVTAHINAPNRLKDRRAAVIATSEMLREAFCIRAESLEALPTQIGSNHDAAADYIYNQLERWAAQPALSELFEAISLSEDVRPVVIMATMRRVPAEEIGVWLTTEFGALSASREAIHCRRYVATKLSAALFELSRSQPSISLKSPDALQNQLDDWASPTGDVEQSLHYQMVIAPFLSFFHDIATGRVAGATR